MTAGWGRGDPQQPPSLATLCTRVMGGSCAPHNEEHDNVVYLRKDTWAHTSQTGARGCYFSESGCVSAAVEAESLLNCAAATRRLVACRLSACVPVK